MLELDSKPVGIVKLEKSIAIGGMDNTVHGYFAKGKKAFSIYLPSPIVTMILLDLKHIQTIKVREIIHPIF
jgi:Bardet-Biedl syndrome 1 protein